MNKPPTRQEWLDLIGRLEASSKDATDPNHQKWCKNNLVIVRKKFAERFPSTEK